MSSTEDLHDKLTQKLTPELLHNLMTQQQNHQSQIEGFFNRFQDWQVPHFEIPASEIKRSEMEIFLQRNPVPVELLRDLNLPK